MRTESYAGTYQLEYLSNGWVMMSKNGREIGAIRAGHVVGVYNIALFFKV